MIKKFLKIYILMIFVFLIFQTVSCAREINLQKEYILHDKPVAAFKIIKDGEEVGYSNSRYYDSSLYTFDQEPNVIELNLNDIITIEDNSIPGTGKQLEKWDLQIYPPSGSNELYVFDNIEDVNRDIILDKAGVWDIYLSVQDDAELIDGITNVSVNGNHRWLGKSKELEDTYIWWYFTQIRIIVKEVDNENSGEELPEEENEDEEIIGKAPLTEIALPDKLYSLEFTQNGDYKNIITWDYYDEDNEKIVDAGYKLYKIQDGQKVLLEEEAGKVKSKDRIINLTGNMLDEFYLSVWVCDESNLKGYDDKKIVIDKIYPKLELNTNERTYIDEYIPVTINEEEKFPNQYLEYECVNWKIYDEANNTIISGDGKIKDKTFISNNNFLEDNFYTIKQYIKFKDETFYIEDKFYIVEILKPEITLNNISGYYGKTYNTNINISQRQSKLKGDLDDYNFEIIEEKTWYEIYDILNTEVYKNYGIADSLMLNENIGIYESEKRQIYKIRQYVTNSKNKQGMAEAFIEVKVKENSKVDIKILDRDNDYTTISNEIYKSESLMIDTEITEGYYDIEKEWFDIKNSKGEIVQKNSGVISGLFKINLEPDSYIITQYIKDTEQMTYESSVSFVIKNVETPVIVLKPCSKKGYYYNETLKLEIDIYDINRSEEHPNGFELYTYYEIDNVNYNGKFISLDVKELERNNNYVLVQHAINLEHTDIKCEEYFDFNILNIKPTLHIDLENKLYVDEISEVIIYANDVDGKITEFNYEIDNELIEEYEEELLLDESNTKKAKFKIRTKDEGEVVITAYCKDDNGGECIIKERINISFNEVPINLYIENENNIDLRQDRYIKWICNSDIADKIELQYKKENDEYLTINMNTDLTPRYEDENVSIYYDLIEKNHIVFSMYFKDSGNYVFSARGSNNNFIGKWKEKTICILPDIVPEISLQTDEYVIRDIVTKQVKIKGNVTVNGLDKSIDYNNIKIYVYKDSLNNELTFVKTKENKFEYISEVNKLGTYYIIGYVKNLEKQLPDISHPLYEELYSKIKFNYSGIKKVNAINMSPNLTFGTSKTDIEVVRYEE